MGTHFTDIAPTDPVVAATINDRLDELDSAAMGGAQANDQTLKEWAEGGDLEFTVATYDSDGVLSSATVKWPDGSAGTFTRTSKNTTWLAVDAYTISHTDSGKTVTQTAVTRGTDGSITAKPALTVA